MKFDAKEAAILEAKGALYARGGEFRVPIDDKKHSDEAVAQKKNGAPGSRYNTAVSPGTWMNMSKLYIGRKGFLCNSGP